MEEAAGKVFGGGMRGEEVFITLLEGMFKFWAETSPRRDQSHVMVTLMGRFKGYVGEKGHIMLLVDTTYLGM